MNNDLISREALKEEIENLIGYSLSYEAILNAIDNAPTVDTGDEKYLEERDNDAFETGYIKGLCESRPQGEWIYGEDDCGQDGWFCSECGFFVPWYYQYYEKDINFIRDYKACPHCLAEMVTYTGKDRDIERS